MRHSQWQYVLGKWYSTSPSRGLHELHGLHVTVGLHIQLNRYRKDHIWWTYMYVHVCVHTEKVGSFQHQPLFCH